MSKIEEIVEEKTGQPEDKSNFFKPLDISIDKELATTSYSNYGCNFNNEENTSGRHVKSALDKRMCALKELVSTEKTYIQNLSEIVNGYIAEIRNPQSDLVLPEALKRMEKMIFSNIDFIYEFHRDQFYDALQSCSHEPAKFGVMTKCYERKFEMYYLYCKNKPMSDYIVTQHLKYFDHIQQKLRHSLDLSNLLIMPIQRITKYKQLFDEISNLTKRAGLVDEVKSIENASIVMNTVCMKANEMMVLSSLHKYEGNISSQGNLLLQGQLLCMDRNATVVQDQKLRKLQLFLFEQSIIFADIDRKKNQFSSPFYNYRAHIMVNKMNLIYLKNSFALESAYSQRSKSVSYICSGSTVEQTQEWYETIDEILQSQNDFATAIQNPIIHQRDNEERTRKKEKVLLHKNEHYK